MNLSLGARPRQTVRSWAGCGERDIANLALIFARHVGLTATTHHPSSTAAATDFVWAALRSGSER